MTIEGWLTQEQAAEKLHIALDTMRRYVREGRFPRTKVGKRYLIPANAIEEFLQKGLLTGPRPVKRRESRPPGAKYRPLLFHDSEVIGQSTLKPDTAKKPNPKRQQ